MDLNRIKDLPEEPGIMGLEKYVLASVLIPLIELDGKNHILFQKRAAHIRQGSEICFPGGLKEPDETFEEAAIRETFEELGLDQTRIEVIGQMDTLVASMGSIIHPFVGRLHIQKLSELQPHKGEVERIFTIPLDKIKPKDFIQHQVRLEVQPSFVDEMGNHVDLLPSRALGLPERYHRPWGGRLQKIHVLPTDQGTIWGITGEILRELIILIND